MRVLRIVPRALTAARQGYRTLDRIGHRRSSTDSTASESKPYVFRRNVAFPNRWPRSTSGNPPPAEMTAPVKTLKGQLLDRTALDSMLRRRMFYTPSFEIYGGVSGLYDYGPPGCALQQNIVDIWRKHFILEEDMLEIDCSVLTPSDVLKTSGHVEKFADSMCKDPTTGEIFRADHYIEEIIEGRLEANRIARGEDIEKVGVDDSQDSKKKRKPKGVFPHQKLSDETVFEYEQILAKIDNYNTMELGSLIKDYNLKNPATGALPQPPVDFNLMFSTSIGPSSALPGYLRPETAQGQFLNFAKLLEFNQQQMPFASASIGRSYRNEISPRSGLLRVREFLMAEIEHFVDPDGGKKHPRFKEVANLELDLLNRKTQYEGSTRTEKMTIGRAVTAGIVDNETLGYFLGRISLFLSKIGIDKSKIRFRQHMTNEMAHYAADCWDAELLTSYGWIECVGCADRSAYDLTVHAKRTGASLIVRQRRPEPVSVTEWVVDLQRNKFGPKFKRDSKAVEAALMETSQKRREQLAKVLEETGSITIDIANVPGGKVTVPREVFVIEQRTRVENIREFVPNVIEPSFGIGRILYALLEHSYWTRGTSGTDEARSVLSFLPQVAPTKVLIVPLSNNDAFDSYCHELSRKLRSMGVSNRIDDSSASIGKRYSRNDELGTPLGITVDFQTVQDGTVTLRDRDSTDQVRSEKETILAAIKAMVEGSKTWEDVKAELPAFQGQELDVVIREA